jgi:hypothetical protein
MVNCIGKLVNCYNDRKICEMLTVNETVETPVTSACWSGACLDIMTDHMQNKFLLTESTGKTPYAGDDGIKT